MITNEYLRKILKHQTAWVGHGLFAMRLVEEFKPKVIVDLGVDYGFSTFCFGHHNIGNVYGIDWFKGDQQSGERNTYNEVMETYEILNKEYGVSNIEFIIGEFNDVAMTWDKQIDILHIDGFHSYESVKNDYDTWSKFCHEDSIILFHDTVSHQKTVGKLFDELNGLKINKRDSAGLGILTKSEEKYKKILSWI
jgi:hypothetical protein